MAPSVKARSPGTAERGFGTTLRIDRWILEPAAIGLVFTGFIIYSLVSSLIWLPAFGVPYEAEGYLS
ncbi:MAG: hypothetical protein ACR2LP_01160, partial [Candidatus Limnocylindrales bacterium]